MRIANKLLVNATNNAYTLTSDPYSVEHQAGYCYVAAYTVASLTNKTFVDANVTVASSSITITAHALVTGQAFTLTTTGVLPGGLALATPYYAIVIDANTIKVASSLANALAGTAVTITSAAGGGTHTVAKTALSGCSVKVQFSLDYLDNAQPASNATWYDVTSSSSNITATGSNYQNVGDVYYPWIRFVITQTNGLLSSASIIVNSKGF